MNLPTVSDRVRFHVSLNVSNLQKSIEFYRTLFGIEPAKQRSDYAKFEPDNPPLVLSLEPTPRPTGGPLNHLGLRMPDSKTLVDMQMRLESSGIRSNREEGVECCYAKQTKFWVADPDGTLWEIYTLEGDIDHRGSGQDVEKMLPQGKPLIAQQTIWEHRVGQIIPKQLDFADNSVDEVRLRGTLNDPHSDYDIEMLMNEVQRILKPNGRLFVHVLTAESRLFGEPGLPGPASVVRHVPLEGEPIKRLEVAGFTGIRMVKFDAKPCFVRNGIAMRELQLEGYKAPVIQTSEKVVALYTGPLDEFESDGHRFVRGRRVMAPRSIVDRLQQSGIGLVVFDKIQTPEHAL
jgi:catechol 2,3-dioxygenase-like lactoylglutathione lyase family enzyme